MPVHRQLILLIIFITASTVVAQISDPRDISAIKSQCGCHEVDFRYAETFAPDKAYAFKDRYQTRGTEWVFVDEETGTSGVMSSDQPGKIVIQHLLVVGDTMVIKHWREDWLFQNTSLLAFDQNAAWKRITLPPEQVKGQWTQQVFEVDDSPRYEGSATWIHADGRHVWESTVDAPLPRREYTKRHDYNVMRRTNHLEITPTGYVHAQDNDKLIRSESGDQLLVSEKGINAYKRTDDAKCRTAKAWWAAHRPYWADVRNVWNEVLANRPAVALRAPKVGLVLARELDDLGTQSLKMTYNSTATRPLIRVVIEKYLN